MKKIFFIVLGVTSLLLTGCSVKTISNTDDIYFEHYSVLVDEAYDYCENKSNKSECANNYIDGYLKHLAEDAIKNKNAYDYKKIKYGYINEPKKVILNRLHSSEDGIISRHSYSFYITKNEKHIISNGIRNINIKNDADNKKIKIEIEDSFMPTFDGKEYNFNVLKEIKYYKYNQFIASKYKVSKDKEIEKVSWYAVIE